MGLNSLFKKKQKGLTSYAQCGEDLILDFVLSHVLQISAPLYVDIGAHHPIKFSNTYLFYAKGQAGVLIEPNAARCEKLRQARPRDNVLNAGLAASRGRARYFMFEPDTLNTFDPVAAQRYRDGGFAARGETDVDLLAVADLMSGPLARVPDLASLDVEGAEMDILRAWDFKACRPALWCIETLQLLPDGSGRKTPEVREFMRPLGYKVYADTYINTIFVDGTRWKGDDIAL